MRSKDKIIHELVYSAAGRFSACETQQDFDTQTKLYAALLRERIDDLIAVALDEQRATILAMRDAGQFT
jgi:hypothetical protein